MIERLLAHLTHLPPEWVVLVIGALPIAEVRGAIPAGVVLLHLPLWKAFCWSLIGNLLPIVPILLFLDPVAAALRRLPVFIRFFDWLFTRTAAKADLVARYEAIGLALFVAVPLPLTGAWTGCVAASIFKIPFRLAFPAITAGVVGAALLVSAAVYAGVQIF